MREELILVDEQDNAIGVMEKLEAHQKGLLHRAFSVFIFNSKGELLLQQRALHKYHSAGLWTNTCCSHPRPNEPTKEAAKRRLQEEMGMSCDLTYKMNFTYKVHFENGLIEHEYDHVFTGISDKNPTINKEEVENFAWMDIQSICKEIEIYPYKYTEWFKIAIKTLKRL